MRSLLFALYVLMVGLAMASVARAQAPQCGPRTTIVLDLAHKHGESQQVAALTDQGVIIEFWANNETGTWTQLASGVDGRSCVVSSGKAWGLTPKKPSPRGNQI